jgi:hypothetical protein
MGLHYRLFFTITGPPKHTNYPPSPLPSAAAISLLVFGVVALGFYWRRVFRDHSFLLFLLLMVAVYGAVLWYQNYSQYLETGRPVAINGRYFIPLLLPLAAVLGRGLAGGLRLWPNARLSVAGLAILLFSQGGGVLGFILRSDPSWYWPSPVVIKVNQTAQAILGPVIFEGSKHY